MRKYLGDRQAFGEIDNSNQNPFGNGFWTVKFDPAILSIATGEIEIYHLALKGPLGSKVEWWNDRTFFDITNHGDVNSWDPNEPCHVMAGTTIYLYWNTGALPKPQVTVWLRQPPILT